MSDINNTGHLETGTTLIFTFGARGCGKTCFLLTLYHYLNKSGRTSLNMTDNAEGIDHVETLKYELVENRILPKATSRFTIKEFDIEFNKRTFTFLDMAGEDLEKVMPAFVKINSLKSLDKINTPEDTNQSNISEFLDPNIENYLANENLPKVILCFVDSEQATKQDILIHGFFSLLHQKYPSNFKKIALVITKWDKKKNNIKFNDFVRNEISQTYYWMKDIIRHPEAFPFSIGIVDEKNRKLKDDLNLEYCKDIVNWLNKSHEDDIIKNQDDSVYYKIYSLIMSFLSNNSSKILEIIKTFITKKS